MKLIKNIKLSWKALLLNKTRTILAVIVLAIGITTIMIMTSISNGAKREISKQFGSLGTKVIVVNSGRIVKISGRQQKISKVTTLSLSDADAILDECPSISMVMPSAEKMDASIKYGNISKKTLIQGGTKDFPEIRNFLVKQGRFFTEEEDLSFSRVAVIGYQIKKNLFGNLDPIGETIFIGNIPFEIIGVLNSKGISPEGSDEDNIVVIPVRTAMRRILNIDYVNRIFTIAKSETALTQAEKEIENLLRDRHKLNETEKENDFSLDNKFNAIEAENDSLKTFEGFALWISVILLFIGGVGILSIMLLSVRERTPEIGLRMAVGARKTDVLKQFQYEALLLGISGGITGILFGLISSWIISKASEWPTYITIESTLISIIISISAGLIFGVFPAFRAAKLDPIKALLKE